MSKARALKHRIQSIEIELFKQVESRVKNIIREVETTLVVA